MGFFSWVRNLFRRDKAKREEIEERRQKELRDAESLAAKRRSEIPSYRESTVVSKPVVAQRQQPIPRTTKTISELPIKSEGVNKIIVQGAASLNDVKPYYEKLLLKNAKLADPEILSIVIQNRQKLKHRFVADVTVYTDRGIVGVATISGILIEETNIVDNYFPVGLVIESNPSKIFEAMKVDLMAKGALAVQYQIFDMKWPVTVMGVPRGMSFA